MINRISLRYTSPLIKITGKSEEVIELPKGSTLKELIAALTQKYGKDFINVVMDETNNRRKMSILVNKKTRELDHCLEGEDIVTFIIFMGGG